MRKDSLSQFATPTRHPSHYKTCFQLKRLVAGPMGLWAQATILDTCFFEGTIFSTPSRFPSAFEILWMWFDTTLNVLNRFGMVWIDCLRFYDNACNYKRIELIMIDFYLNDAECFWCDWQWFGLIAPDLIFIFFERSAIVRNDLEAFWTCLECFAMIATWSWLTKLVSVIAWIGLE